MAVYFHFIETMVLNAASSTTVMSKVVVLYENGRSNEDISLTQASDSVTQHRSKNEITVEVTCESESQSAGSSNNGMSAENDPGSSEELLQLSTEG